MAAQSATFGTNAGTEWELFLRTYGGVALSAFLEKTVMSDKIRTRRISGSKSAVFPQIGTASASYHSQGDNLLEDGSYESNPFSGEQTVYLDNILISTILVSDIDELLSYHDVRVPYAQNQAHALARQLDLDLMKVCVSGSEDVAITGYSKAGSKVADGDFESGTVADALETIRNCAKKMDLANVPQEGRHMILGPTQYHRLRTDETVASTDYNANTGGDVGTGQWLQYAGFKIHMSALVEDATETTGFRIDHTTPVTGKKNGDYEIDCSDTKAVFFQESGIGHVRGMDLSVEAEYHQLYQGTVLTARMVCGSAVLRPEACGSIQTA